MQEKLKIFERMSQVEIDSLNDEDKKLYIEVILSKKKQEAILRRRQYEDQILKSKEKKSVRINISMKKTWTSFTRLISSNFHIFVFSRVELLILY